MVPQGIQDVSPIHTILSRNKSRSIIVLPNQIWQNSAILDLFTGSLLEVLKMKNVFLLKIYSIASILQLTWFFRNAVTGQGLNLVSLRFTCSLIGLNVVEVGTQYGKGGPHPQYGNHQHYFPKEFKELSCEVPQGSILGQILFILLVPS